MSFQPLMSVIHCSRGAALAGLLGLLCACEVPADGKDGLSGEDGVAGLVGEDGAPGADGAPGDDGAPGADGEPGAMGVSGADGEDGEAGATGLPGVDGEDGIDGEDGEDGRDGRDGRDALGGTLLDPRVAPVRLSLSLTGHDRLYAVTFDSEGNIFATGQVASDIASHADFSFVLAKFLPSGELDPTFGNDGVVTYNAAVGGKSVENARGVVVQSSGRIVIAGTAEHDPGADGLLANDTDIVLLGWNPDGSLDTSFGTGGKTVVDVSAGVIAPNSSMVDTLMGGDSQYALALAPNDALVVHGLTRGEGFKMDGITPRSDTDWLLVRLTADGVLDTTFGDEGAVTLDIAEADAHARAMTVLEDGSVIGTGYTTSTALGVSAQQPVLYKVDANGDFDALFAASDAWTANGVWHDLAVAPPLRAEVYGAAPQGDKLVTIGYGPTIGTGTGSDWISFRYTSSGAIDATYGVSGGGATYVDAGGYADNGRFVLVLPDDRVLGLGGGREAPSEALPMGQSPEVDAMILQLTANGAPDETFATGGFELYDMGGSDFFWGGAVAPNQSYVAIVGIAGAEQSGVNDDDSLLYLMPIE